jgi:hypothetical protein
MKTLMLVPAILALCCLEGCRSIFVAPTPVRDGTLLVTEGDVARPYQVLGHVSGHQTGWYLFALIPVVPIDLHELLHVALPRAAVAMGADAILFAKYEMTPPSILSFSPILLPDWSASAVATGMAVRFIGDADEKR